jgi:hypothetical protein
MVVACTFHVLTGFFSAVLVTGERLYSGSDAAGSPPGGLFCRQ